MANLAITKRNLGKLDEAEQLEERVLEVRKKIEDKEGPNVLTAMANLAITKRDLGKLEEAEQLRISKGADSAVGKYMETFVREAIARAAVEKESSGGGWGSFMEVEDLEKLAPQLVLDF